MKILTLFKVIDNNKKLNDGIIFLIGLFLFAYVVIRAIKLSFIYDESWTYLCYVIRRFINYKNFGIGDTNNHLLNTWLMELSVKFFGTTEFTLRLPNVLAYLLYLIYSAKLVRNLSSGIMIVCAFLILNLNPFMIDFFSLARGYGISMGLLMTSLYFAYKYINKGKIFSAFLAVFYASLAVFAYFILINFLLIITGLLLLNNFMTIIKDSTLKLKALRILKNSVIILLPLSSLFYIIPVLKKLKASGSMDFGGNEGFWKDTVEYLIRCTLYNPQVSDTIVMAFEIFVATVVLISMLFLLYQLIKKKNLQSFSFFLVVFIAILLCFVANYSQNILMEIPYPQGRYGLTYFVLFALLLIFLFENFNANNRIVFKIIFSVITFCFLINFIWAINFNHVHDWANENDTKDMINYLIKNKENVIAEKENINLGVSFQWRSDANFYRVLNHLNWLNPIDTRTAFSPLNDYYYIGEEDTAMLQDIPYQVLKRFPETKTMLLKNKIKWHGNILCSMKNNFEDSLINNHQCSITSEKSYSGKFSSKITLKCSFTPVLTDSIDNTFFNDNKKMVLVKAMLYATSLHTDASVVIVHQDKSNLINYYAQSLQELIIKPDEWTPIYFAVILPDDIHKGESIAAYCWNVGHHDIYIDDLEMKIIGFEIIPQ